jgi:2-iminobutanoate/2-iminopropanoate deaminase
MSEQATNKLRNKILSSAPSSDLPFSRTIAYAGLVFVSGTVGREPETGQIAQDVAQQVRQVLDNIDHQLTMTGTSLDRALKATVFLTNMELYEEMNKAYGSFFGEAPPARSCVEVSALPDEEALIEIEVIAAR